MLCYYNNRRINAKLEGLLLCNSQPDFVLYF